MKSMKTGVIIIIANNNFTSAYMYIMYIDCLDSHTYTQFPGHT